LLDELLAEPASDWVGVVAVQLRARLRLAAGQVTRAVEELAAAAGRWPEEPSLAVALAHAARLAGERSRSRAALHDASGVAALHDASGVAARFDMAPRKRYAEPPLRQLAATAAEVERLAWLDLPALAAALEAP
jgi:hypothetical protein